MSDFTLFMNVALILSCLLNWKDVNNKPQRKFRKAVIALMIVGAVMQVFTPYLVVGTSIIGLGIILFVLQKVVQRRHAEGITL